MRRGIGGEPLEFEPPSPIKVIKVIPLTPRSSWAWLVQPSAAVPPRIQCGTASSTTGVVQPSLAQLLATKAAPPWKDTWFSSADAIAGSRVPATTVTAKRYDSSTHCALFLRFSMISATHPKTERERLRLSLSQIALLWCDS